MKDWENRLSLDVKQSSLSDSPLEEQLFTVLSQRLRYEEPFMPRWREAIGLGLLPHNLPVTAARLQSTMNTVWGVVGDNADGMAWHYKRIAVGQIFVASEMVMVRDGSKGFEETYAFLRKQIERGEFESIWGVAGFWTGNVSDFARWVYER
jgi:ubiquinone biosynthesis protein COQ9